MTELLVGFYFKERKVIMKKFLKYLVIISMIVISGGCCIDSRCWKIDKEIEPGQPLGSGRYHYYTNGLMKAHTFYSVTSHLNVTYMVKDGIYKYCSNANGPWAGSDIYPATRHVLNALSLMSYSSAASGDYMLGLIIIPTYPIWIVELPIQLVLDTVLLPWDLISAPTTPPGYKKVF